MPLFGFQNSNGKSIPIIHIIGLPGSGKTTLARKLSKAVQVSVLCIDRLRTRFPQTPIGEADAWIALFRELSRHRWKNCILETTGLNRREEFLRTALPFGQVFTIKLDASRKTLFTRIRKKKKRERGGRWFYGAEYRNKYEFVRKLFKHFHQIPANCHINTNGLTRAAVYLLAIKETNMLKKTGVTCQ